MRFGVLALMYIRIRVLLADEVVLSVERRLSNSAAYAVNRGLGVYEIRCLGFRPFVTCSDESG
jgi:hypothetical protein